MADVQWPGVLKYVVTTGKFNTRKLAKASNIEVGYPAETPWIATLAAWAGGPANAPTPQESDALNLFALLKILAGDHVFDYALIVQDISALPTFWEDVHSSLDGRCVATFGPSTRCNIVFDINHRLTEDMLSNAWDFYTSGAVFALKSYSVAEALAMAEQATIIASQAVEQHCS